MARSRYVALLAAGLASGCTFTGLGSYDVPTCNSTLVLGSVNATNDVGDVSGTPQISYTPGGGGGAGVAVAAFVVGTGSGGVQLADKDGTVGGGTPLFSSDLVPMQPFAVPIGTGYAAVTVATTAPCRPGRVTLGTFADSMAGTPSPDPSACPSAALPSLVELSNGTQAWVAWYETDASLRSDPIGGCAGASAAPLRLALASGVATPSPTLGTSVELTKGSTSISLRPPAMTLAGSDVLLASPDGNAVSLWDLQGTSSSPAATLTLSGLAGARAVSIATDGGENIAVVAEIGCTPQAIVLALGTLSEGFATVTTVAAAASSPTEWQVEPTVAWVADQGYWNVSWLSNSGGTHALAQRVDTHGVAVGGVLDPHANLLAATLTSDGTLFGYVDPTTGMGSVEAVGLGCALGPGGNESAQE